MPANTQPTGGTVGITAPVKGKLQSSIIRKILYSQGLTLGLGGVASYWLEKISDAVHNHPEQVQAVFAQLAHLPLPPWVMTILLALASLVMQLGAQIDRARKPDIAAALTVPGAPTQDAHVLRVSGPC
jgi:phage-related protein